MSANTLIEWADHTFNPWTGCTAISPACDHCYAAAWAKRAGRDFAERKRTKTWRDPEKWQAQAAAFMAQHGRRQRVFCASLADVFDNQAPHAWRVDLYELIERTPDLDWLLLTKRIGNARYMLPACWGDGLPNVWIGATITSQEEADRDIPKLLQVPARVRFLSMEPLLGPVDLPAAKAFGLHGFGRHVKGVDWVIVGGESGPGARPMHPDWARGLRDQCASAGVPFLFKQWGEFSGHGIDADGEIEPGLPMRLPMLMRWDGDTAHLIQPDEPVSVAMAPGVISARVGKDNAGRLLDGIEHNEFPKAV